jgi:hypothetical protein
MSGGQSRVGQGLGVRGVGNMGKGVDILYNLPPKQC